MSPDLTLFWHLLAFAVAGLICFVGAYRARWIPEPDTRRGLQALLITSGLWAGTHVGVLLPLPPALQSRIYAGGLIVGFATVGAWLYFCSAYTGRALHRSRTARWCAGLVFGAVSLAKLTNPLHELYYVLEPTGGLPAPEIHPQPLYWVGMGLAYALAAPGYFMLFELFERVHTNTKPLVVLTGLTGLPLLLNGAGQVYSGLPNLPYEPLGVAVFAGGALFVYEYKFEATRMVMGRRDATLFLSSDGRLKDYNQKAAAIFPDLENAQVLGAPLRDVLPELTDALNADPDRAVIETGPDTDRHYYRVLEAPFGSGSPPQGRLILLNDVTNQVRRKERLKAAKAEAEEAARLKSALLRNLNHEFRTPLTSIISFSQIIEKRPELTEQFAGQVVRGGKRLLRTLNTVMDFAELEGGETAPTPTVFDACNVASTVARDFRPDAERKGLHLRVERPDAPVAVRLDSHLLERIVTHLVSNAVKFTEQGTVTLGVRAAGPTVELWVEDSGIGMDPAFQPHAYEEFTQASTGVTRTHDGLGLGLPIAKRFTEQMGGTIEMESTSGEGTRMTVRFDARPDEAAGPGNGIPSDFRG